MGKLKNWTEEEDQILMTSFEKFESRKWKNISKILLEKGFLRGEAQCRQRYVNHLDPILDKNSEISQDQLHTLYTKYQQYGPKWCLIQTFVPNRTQIKIKNVFYGNIRLFLKKLYKYFTKKTYVFINQLKTDDLQSIYDGTQEFKGLCLIKKAFRKLHYKINQQNCIEIIQKSETDYFILLNKILENKTKIKPLEYLTNIQDFKTFEKSVEQNKIENKQVIKSSQKENQEKSFCQDLKKESFQAQQKKSEGMQQLLSSKQIESPFVNIFQTPIFFNFPLCSIYFPNEKISSPGLIGPDFFRDHSPQEFQWQTYRFQFLPISDQISTDISKI